MLSKKNSIIVGCLFAVTLMTAQTYPAAYPQTEISNGMLRAKVYLPDVEKGFYRGMRFDWAGVMASLEYNGHGYFGPFFEKFDLAVSDVEIGNPVRVATMTVMPAPTATARRKYSEVTSWSGTRPLPENFFKRVWAKNIEQIEPEKVVMVAQRMAVRYEVVLLPNNDATPLKLSLAPFE